MSISEQEALAEQLFAIHEEALGEPHSWEDLKSNHKAAWRIVAQFVEVRYRAYGIGTGWGVLLSGYDEPDYK